MKKLFSILFAALTMFGTALAEGEVIGGADAATEIVVSSGVDLGKLFSNGLIVTAGGLCGVFLVLILFFLTIKAMQKLIK